MAITFETHEAPAPLGAGRRVFRRHDHPSLWFSHGAGLLVNLPAWLTRRPAAGGPSAPAQSRG